MEDKNEKSRDDLKDEIRKEIEYEKLNEKKIGSTGWIVFAFFMAVLVPLVGVIMGAVYRGKKYDEKTRESGGWILGVSIACWIFWFAVNMSAAVPFL